MTLDNSALTYRTHAAHAGRMATVSIGKTILNRLLAGQAKVGDAIGQGDIQVSGDQQSMAALFGMLDSFSPSFDLVTPAPR